MKRVRSESESEDMTYWNRVAFSCADVGRRWVGQLGLEAAGAVVVCQGKDGVKVVLGGKVGEGKPGIGGKEGGVAEMAEGVEGPAYLSAIPGLAPGVVAEFEMSLGRASAGQHWKRGHGARDWGEVIALSTPSLPRTMTMEDDDTPVLLQPNFDEDILRALCELDVRAALCLPQRTHYPQCAVPLLLDRIKQSTVSCRVCLSLCSSPSIHLFPGSLLVLQEACSRRGRIWPQSPKSRPCNLGNLLHE